MTHEALRERLLDLAYGELPPRAAREVEEHAVSCEACRAELGRIRETRRLMSALPEEPAPAEGERILLAAAREAARRRQPERTLPRWVFGGSLVAASLAAVVAVSYRVATMRPRSGGSEDVNALVGESPYARPPPPEPATPEPAAREPAEPAGQRNAGATESRREPPAATGRASRAPERQRFAASPPAPEAAAPAAPARENERKAASEPPVAGFSAPAPAQRALPSRAEDEGAPAPAPPDANAVRDRAELPPAAAAAAPPRPAPSRGAKAAARPEARVREAPLDAAPAGSDAVARYEALRAEGRVHAEERTFPGCTHELWRRVERDPEGRVVSYAWEEVVGTQRLRLEAVYGPDGKLARKRAFDARTSAPAAFVKFRVPPAASIDIDAPPRCGE